MIPSCNSNSNNSNPLGAPGIVVNPGTPFPPTTPGLQQDETCGRFLPTLSQRRSVLSGGRPVSDLPPYESPAPVKHEYALDSCTRSFADPGSQHGGFSRSGGPHPGSQQQLLQLHGGAPAGRGRSHLLRPPNTLNPVSPTFSDVSSVRLTPKSPSMMSRYSTLGGSVSVHEVFKTPEGSRKNSLSGRQLHPASLDLDDTALFPLYPPLQSYSPYLSSPLLNSPQCLIGSRKRTLSVSPFSDLVDLNAMRGSPNSLAIAGISPFQPGCVGHLIGHLPSPVAPSPAFVQYQVQQRKTSIERNPGRLTITNEVTFTETGSPAMQHCQDYSYTTAGGQGTAVWSSGQTSMDNMVLSSGCRPGDMDTDSARDRAAASVLHGGGGGVGGVTSEYGGGTGAGQMEVGGGCSRPVLTCGWKGCTVAVDDQDELARHIEKVHVEPKRSQDEYICLWDKCSRGFKPFNARYKLLIHMRTHSGEKPNHCTFPGCDKAFSRMENLRIHLRSHTGERPYPCQFPGCAKTFSNSSDRSKHQRTHYDQKPYACTHPGCTKKYTDPSSLRKHIRTHTQPRKKVKNDDEELNNILTVQPLHKAATTKGKGITVGGFGVSSHHMYHPGSSTSDSVAWPQYANDQVLGYGLQPLTPLGPCSSSEAFSPVDSFVPSPQHSMPTPTHPPPPYSSH